MAICTLKAHVSRALDFYNKDNIYFCIGKTTEWSADDIDDFDPSRDYDQNPPLPSITSDMTDIIGYKKIEFKSPVVQDDNGTLEYRGTKWRAVSPSLAVEEGARWIFISAGLTYNELPADKPYREIGVYTGLTPNSGVPSAQYALLPSQVDDQGLLEVIDFRRPIWRDTDVRERICLVLEF